MIKINAKHLLIAGICVIVIHHPLIYAESNKEKIQDIKKICASIEAEQAYKKVQVDVMDKSADGGVAVGYFDSGELKKIVEKLYGETGRVTTEYYFDAEKLIFVFTKSKRYKQTEERPAYGPVYRICNERYYFLNDKLIYKQSQWTDKAGHELSDPGPEYSSPDLSGDDLLKEAAELKGLILRSK